VAATLILQSFLDQKKRDQDSGIRH
jgi:hypothetical protein